MNKPAINRWSLILLVSLLSACAAPQRGERPRVVEPTQPAPSAPRSEPTQGTEPAPLPPVRTAPAKLPTPLPREQGSLPPAQQAPGMSAPQGDGASQGDVVSPSPASRIEALPPAARSLVAKAEAASNAGRHDEAAAYLERALRIAPRNPQLWQNLAVVRYRQKDYAKVEGLAQRSNALAPATSPLRKTNWELIATVRKLLGDARGAAAAAAEARRYMN
jgi:Putative Zn-dependent protease, contains TPR repeats